MEILASALYWVGIVGLVLFTLRFVLDSFWSGRVKWRGSILGALFFATLVLVGYQLNHPEWEISSLGGGMEAFIAGVLTWFLFGTLGFWVVVALALWYIVYATEKFWAPSATIVFLVAIGFLSYANSVNPIDWILNNPLLSFGIVVGYVAAGVGWMLFKFRRFAKKIVELLDSVKIAFLRQHDAKDDQIPEEYISDWNEDLEGGYEKYVKESDRRFLDGGRLDSRPWHHKSRIMFWMIYWPFSLTHDLLTDLYEMVYEAVSKKLERISAELLGERVKDLDLKPTPISRRSDRHRY